MVLDGEELVGFFSAHETDDAEIWEIALGMRPDLVGKGRGAPFLCAALRELRRTVSVDSVVLNVAAFNTRAIKAYESVGFRTTAAFIQHTNGGHFDFVRMELVTRDA